MHAMVFMHFVFGAFLVLSLDFHYQRLHVAAFVTFQHPPRPLRPEPSDPLLSITI